MARRVHIHNIFIGPHYDVCRHLGALNVGAVVTV